MRSLWGSLLSLVLPTGAVVPPRVVLDGTSGEIRAEGADGSQVVVGSNQGIATVSMTPSAGTVGGEPATIAAMPPGAWPGDTTAGPALWLSSPIAGGGLNSPALVRLCGQDADSPAHISLTAGGAGGYIEVDGALRVSGVDVSTLPLGLVAPPIATSDAGPSVSALSSPVRDDVLGALTVTTYAGRRYRISLISSLISTTVADSLYIVQVRDGGAGVPTGTSALIARANGRPTMTGGEGQVTVHALATWAPTAGTHTLAAFIQKSAGTGIGTLLGPRELVIEDIGAA